MGDFLDLLKTMLRDIEQRTRREIHERDQDEAQMRKALEAAEWGGRTNDEEACPVCGNESRVGHESDCLLAVALKKEIERGF